MNLCLFISLELIFALSTHGSTKHCSEKLLENKNKVPDSAFTESSYKEEFKGKWARESASTEMAWCPNNTIFKLKKDFLMIDLGDIYVLKMIMTKGLSRHGFISASSYIIEYKRESHTKWLTYRSRGKEKKLKGNLDHLTESFESLDPSIIARWIKIFPYAEKSERICLVLQIYGCNYSSHVMEYRIPDGDTQNNLNDFNYDGFKQGNSLLGGLGKLVLNTDSIIEDPFDPKNEQLIGWYKQQLKTNKVQMIFRFSNFRNFSQIRIQTSNYFSKNIRLFSSIEIHFSNDGINYEENRFLRHIQKEDDQKRNFRFLEFSMKENVGLFVKVILVFRSDWIILKAVEFISESAKEIESASQKPMVTKEPSKFTPKPNVPYHENEFFSIPLAYSLVIVISVLIIMLLIGIPCVTLFVRRQKYRNKKCKEAIRRHFQEEQARFLALSQQQFKDSAISNALFTVSNFNPSLPNINGRMMQESSIYTSLAGSDTESNCPSDKQQCMAQNFNFINTCPIINPLTANRGSISNDYSATSFTNLGSNGASYIPYYINNAQIARSQINLKSHYDIVNPTPTIQKDSYFTDEHCQRSIPMYGPARISIQGPLRNSKLHSLIPMNDSETMLSLSSSLQDFTYAKTPLHNLKYVKTISRGQYGSIHVGEWVKIQDSMTNTTKKFTSDDYNTLRQSLTTGIETENIIYQFPEKQISSIKVLSKNSSVKIKNEFYKEIKKLLTINHKNFPSILKIEETPLGDCVVVSEYTPINDVFSYLQDFNFKDESGTKTISQTNLVYIASQIASGMKHLEFLKLIHRDLSCRNVFIMNDELLIKISDLAMANEKFSSDYIILTDPSFNQIHKSTSSLIQLQTNSIHSFHNPNEANLVIVLPIRWMPWQALLQGTFSSKTDVYSFGVTLWELLTLCRKQPYHELTNEQVIINSNLQALGDERARNLLLPKRFSREFSDFLTHCMNFDESVRPSFIEIDMFLQHKSVGFKLQ